jgi:hypothetical protein
VQWEPSVSEAHYVITPAPPKWCGSLWCRLRNTVNNYSFPFLNYNRTFGQPSTAFAVVIWPQFCWRSRNIFLVRTGPATRVLCSLMVFRLNIDIFFIQNSLVKFGSYVCREIGCTTYLAQPTKIKIVNVDLLYSKACRIISYVYSEISQYNLSWNKLARQRKLVLVSLLFLIFFYIPNLTIWCWVGYVPPAPSLRWSMIIGSRKLFCRCNKTITLKGQSHEKVGAMGAQGDSLGPN